jgi:hypothetical protein
MVLNISGAEMEGLRSLRCAVLPSPGSDRAAGLLLRGLVRFCSRRNRVGQRGRFQSSKQGSCRARCVRPAGNRWTAAHGRRVEDDSHFLLLLPLSLLPSVTCPSRRVDSSGVAPHGMARCTWQTWWPILVGGCVLLLSTCPSYSILGHEHLKGFFII